MLNARKGDSQDEGPRWRIGMEQMRPKTIYLILFLLTALMVIATGTLMHQSV